MGGEIELVKKSEVKAQQILERIHRKKDGIKNPRVLLYTSARNAIIDHYRTRKEHAQVPPENQFSIDEESDQPMAVVGELALCLRPLIEQLSEKYRAAIIRVDLERQTHKAAAEQENISISGMKLRVQRGRM